MTTVIGVRFKHTSKVYYFDPGDAIITAGQDVIVETARGVEYGECTMGNTPVPDETVVQPLKKLIRIATKTDRQIVEENERAAEEAFNICKKKIEEHQLDMHLVSVEYTFDLNKILFYFTADGRVDFRDLVKDLAAIFRTRIELRQIGVRDEAKMIGGLGICGRPLCCTTYMDEFAPVSINMAKDQNLSLNPAKISGTCGRLMCCLKYEHEAYQELQKQTPRVDSLVETPEGRGTILSTQMLRGTCKVQLDNDPNNSPKIFSCGDCCVLRSGRAARNTGGCGGCGGCAPATPKEEIQKNDVSVSTNATPAESPQAPRTDSQPATDKPRRRKRSGTHRHHKPNETDSAPAAE